MSNLRNSFLSLSLLVIALGAASPAHAQTNAVDLTVNHDTLSGNVRYASMGGDVTLAPGAQVVDVRIFWDITTDPGAWGQAQGTYNATTKKWAVTVGDYRMLEYVAQVTIKQGNQYYYFVTPYYYWVLGR